VGPPQGARVRRARGGVLGRVAVNPEA
jgi:hypothetical protein